MCTSFREHLPTCEHLPRCPGESAPDREAARTVASHPEQGWSLLCNGVVVFDDTGELLPDGSAIEPHRGPVPVAPGAVRLHPLAGAWHRPVPARAARAA